MHRANCAVLCRITLQCLPFHFPYSLRTVTTPINPSPTPSKVFSLAFPSRMTMLMITPMTAAVSFTSPTTPSRPRPIRRARGDVRKKNEIVFGIHHDSLTSRYFCTRWGLLECCIRSITVLYEYRLHRLTSNHLSYIQRPKTNPTRSHPPDRRHQLSFCCPSAPNPGEARFAEEDEVLRVAEHRLHRWIRSWRDRCGGGEGEDRFRMHYDLDCTSLV